MTPRVYIHTLGCPKNEADSRGLARALVAAGIKIVDSPEECSHLVVNTCGFIQDAKEESIAAILEACSDFADRQVLVMGCLVQRYRRELAEGIPEVSGWYGIGETARLVHDLATGPISADDGQTEKTEEPSFTQNEPLLLGAEQRGEAKAYAYLKISDGCDETCTFCAIPAIKGPYQALGRDEILREADACLSEGARELILVGQNTAIWRDGKWGLMDLVDELAADERVHWIRLMYLQPDDVDEELLFRMACQPKVCRYLDLPFQHADPEILRRMGRRGDMASHLALLRTARRLMPDVSLRSTFIVGFPGEREEHFARLLEFVEEARFDHAGAFIYSPEEGTPAASSRPRVRRKVAMDRLNRLHSLLFAVAEEEHQRLLDRRLPVIIDKLEAESDLELEGAEGVLAVGRTYGQAPEIDGVTYIEGGLPPTVKPGDVVPVRVTAVVGYDLVGYGDIP